MGLMDGIWVEGVGWDGVRWEWSGGGVMGECGCCGRGGVFGTVQSSLSNS